MNNEENMHFFKEEVDFSKYLQWVSERLDELDKKDYIKSIIKSELGFEVEVI